MPTKTWVVGEEVLAADFNAFVQKQIVATFPNAAGRDAAIPAPTAGMTCWLDSPKVLQVHDGTAWQTVPGAGVPGVTYAEWTGGSGDVANVPTWLGLSVGYTASGGRRVKVSAYLTMQQKGSAGVAHAYIREGATSIVQSAFTLNVNEYATFTPTRVLTPSAGFHSYDLYFSTDSGVCSVVASAGGGDLTAHMMVHDIG